jgi:copper resistance protein C
MAAPLAVAHDVLRSTNPADGAVVDQLPDRVVLTFDEPALAIGTEVQVTGPDGPVTDGTPQLVNTEVRQPVRAGPAGRYTVVWRVTSADGHPVSGTFSFTAQQPRASTSPTSPSPSPSTTTTTTTTSTPATTGTVTASPAAPESTAGVYGTAVALVVGVLALLGIAGWVVIRQRRRRV